MSPIEEEEAPKRGLSSYLNEDVRKLWVLWLLPLMTFESGVIDAVTVESLGHTFVCNQTGNYVFLGISLFSAEGTLMDVPVHSIVALVSFGVGSMIGGRLGSICGDTKRVWLFSTFCFQGFIGILCCIMSFTMTLEPEGHMVLIPIGLLGIASGMQMIAARRFKVAEYTTAVLTSTTMDFMADGDLFKWKNPTRDKRAASILCLFVGVVVGHSLIVFIDVGTALLFAAIIRFIVAFGWLLLPNKKKANASESLLSSHNGERPV
ncbi:hypothetical protein PROFUN_01397 [Planoprotostelium fungivorum]|uniref:DUF1275 domain protein n=1 Tax=Planoprotostelium fungivorum TaxID=1890364 RepID=A0A2P6NT37_9EUKA|nr:hypothetical protein PROFUN_01397 [Planoprotostelium fungivorum]